MALVGWEVRARVGWVETQLFRRAQFAHSPIFRSEKIQLIDSSRLLPDPLPMVEDLLEKDVFDQPAQLYGHPSRALLCDFTFVYETQDEKDRRLSPDWSYNDESFGNIVACLPGQAQCVTQLPDSPPSTGSEVVGHVIELTAAFWQLLGIPGLPQLGQKIRKWLREKKGHSGNVGALLPVAISYIHEQFTTSRPDIQRVQFISACSDSRYPADYQAVFLYRIYDYDNEHVYLAEVDSQGNLISCICRTVSIFESMPIRST